MRPLGEDIASGDGLELHEPFRAGDIFGMHQVPEDGEPEKVSEFFEKDVAARHNARYGPVTHAEGIRHAVALDGIGVRQCTIGSGC